MTADYALLPFRFHRLDDERCLLTNFAGDYCILSAEDLKALVHHQLAHDAPCYDDLVARHFVLEPNSTAALDLLAAQYRTRQAHLSDLACLHIFVVTLRCTNRCIYCQTTRQERFASGWDMTQATADHAIEFAFQSPSPTLKIEFQGGEPLLNFPLVRHITEACELRAAATGKQVEFVLCTNLNEFSEEHGEYCRSHCIAVSTSLDGPADLHDRHRWGSHARVCGQLPLVRSFVGRERVSALMTPTRHSLGRVKEIIDEYLAQGFRAIFLRPLNPYGYAAANDELSVTIPEWLEFYKEGLAYVLELNRQGVRFREEFAAILLRRILTLQPGGFVDLQSPTGAGTAVLVYYGDGVYASDEARMLAVMGDQRFRLATLGRDTFGAAMLDTGFLDLVTSTMAEGVPRCHTCAFQPYCGADPVGHYREQRDTIGHKAQSAFCARHIGVFSHLFELLGTDAAPILASWL